MSAEKRNQSLSKNKNNYTCLETRNYFDVSSIYRMKSFFTAQKKRNPYIFWSYFEENSEWKSRAIFQHLQQQYLEQYFIFCAAYFFQQVYSEWPDNSTSSYRNLNFNLSNFKNVHVSSTRSNNVRFIHRLWLSLCVMNRMMGRAQPTCIRKVQKISSNNSNQTWFISLKAKIR